MVHTKITSLTINCVYEILYRAACKEKVIDKLSGYVKNRNKNTFLFQTKFITVNGHLDLTNITFFLTVAVRVHNLKSDFSNRYGRNSEGQP